MSVIEALMRIERPWYLKRSKKPTGPGTVYTSPLSLKLREEGRALDRTVRNYRILLATVVVLGFALLMVLFGSNDAHGMETKPGVVTVYGPNDSGYPVAYMVTVDNGSQFLCTMTDGSPPIKYTCTQLSSDRSQAR